MNDDQAIAAETDVQFEAVRTQRHGVVERRKRVLGRERGAAAVGEDQRPRGGKEWMFHAGG
jgi:hypothetical protein